MMQYLIMAINEGFNNNKKIVVLFIFNQNEPTKK